jgi:hypothetical protein
MAQLLPPDTLQGIRLGLSASPSPHLARLGLLEGHFQLALGEMARTVLVLGGRLQYCGHLDRNSYTLFLIGELKRYGRRDDPLSIVLSWSVHRRLPLEDIRRIQDDLGLLGRITFLDPAGGPIDPENDRTDAPPGVSTDQIASSLSAMRHAAILQIQGRLLIGGRRTGYEGVMPGVLEEALLSIEAGKPVFLAGGFGGVTHDIVRAVDPGAAAWLPAFSEEANNEGCDSGVEMLRRAIANRGWTALSNGLDDAENARLASTHRPSEIASLVGLGLGRLSQAGFFKK